MIKMSSLAAALLFAFVSSAYADTQTSPTSQGATSVQKNLDANKSKGQADKGLNNALTHITAQHGNSGAAGENAGTAEKSERVAHAERHENMAAAERPARIERPARVERPAR